jgi:hypothetical protein
MSATVICHGCGQGVEVPDGYRRNKIQCPECGVICPIPAAAQARTGTSRRDAPEPTFDEIDAPASQPGRLVPDPAPPEPEPPPAPRAARAPGRPPTPAPRAEERVWTCDHCGERLPRRPRGRDARCPVCGTAVARPTRSQVVKPSAPVVPLPAADEPELDWSHEDDGKPYNVGDRGTPPCPNCKKPLPSADAAVCVRCGFDRRTGRKVEQTFRPISKSWDAGLPLKKRLLCFGVWQAFAIPGTLWGGMHEGHGPYAVLIWLVLSAMAAFLAGTFVHLDLTRDTRGRVFVVKTWRFGFVPWTPQKIDLRDYEGIVTGQTRDVGATDWFVFGTLFLFGILPGLIWLLVVMQKDTFYVALTRDHGHPVMPLYQGWSEAVMHEIEEAVRDAAAPVLSWYAPPKREE